MFGTGLLGPIGSAVHERVNRVRFRLRPVREVGSLPKKLHLGCGSSRAAGFCNVDITGQLSVEVVDDVSRLAKFPDNHAEMIYACHVLEHFSHAEIPLILERWLAVLAPGGELRISVPDIDRIVRIYSRNWDHFQRPGNTPWIGLIYGGQTDQYDFHKTGFNFCWMAELLRNAGFDAIEEYPHEPHFIPGLADASLSKPFAEFISLNVKASKPNPAA
jgi:predicted SAM-dependent methyltransferase